MFCCLEYVSEMMFVLAYWSSSVIVHHDSSVVLPLEYFDMMILCLDYLLDIAMTWIIV